MLRISTVIAAAVLIAGCNMFQSPAETVEAEPPAPPPPVVDVVTCPEPEPAVCVCPEPEKVMVPAPPPEPCTAGTQDLLIIGAIEHVEVDATGLRAQARIDTGAQTSSIHAEEIVEFERDGKAWVRFKFDGAEGQDVVTIEKRVSRRVRIKQHDDDLHRRYVVKMRIRLGELTELIEMSLSDRSDFEFPVLIGRNFLTDNAVVDVSKQFVMD